ncbi:hypothetical protein Tco_0862654 [Tanacetum coccineum]
MDMELSPIRISGSLQETKEAMPKKVTIHGEEYDVHVQELGRGLLILMISHFKILTQTLTWIANDMSKDQDKIIHSNAYNVACKEETEIQMGRMEKSNSSDWSRPPGLEHYKNTEKESSTSSL